MLAQTYPRAAAHLAAAVDARRRLARAWSEMGADGLVEEIVVTGPDGTGRLCLCGSWPDGARAALTVLFQACIDELWAGLDSLVAETVAALSILERRTAAEKDRFFPVAETAEGFVALLEESCLDGVLATQEVLVSDCQPFRSSPSAETPRRIRVALARLLDWTNRLHDGAQVGAWVTPVDPEVEIEDSDQVLDLQVASPCPLDDETVVATYTVAPGARVIARAGSYLDLALPDGFDPVDKDDTFDARLALTIQAVTVLAGCFARLFESTSTVRKIENDGGGTWTPADRSRRGWSAEELKALRASELGIGVVRDGDKSIILLTTAAGIFERRIPAATPLNPHIEPGLAAESATHNAAATWGLPDFVLLPLKVHAGSRNREISDGLLLAGERGVVLQTKNRAAARADPEREASWVTKKIAEAARQIHGTVRRLRAESVEMTNGRGRRVRVVGEGVSWVGVVIIDHPNPLVDLPLVDHSSSSTAVVVLLRREWEFLFDQLRSARAVIDYLHRVAGPCARLGEEPERYFELATADAAAEPEPVLPGLAGDRVSAPLLPLEPAGHTNDPAHGIVRVLCEDIATSPLDAEEHERTSLLAAIDRLPVAHRSDLGQLVLDELRTARTIVGDDIRWRFRTYRTPLETPQVGFGVCSVLNDTTRAAFRSWVLLRHHERGPVNELDDALTIGVLLTPHDDGLRDWDTTMLAVRGDPCLNDDDLKRSRRLWNSSDMAGTGPTTAPSP